MHNTSAALSTMQHT